MGFKKVAARYPLWNPHYKGEEKDFSGKPGDYLRGYVLRVRTEGIGENMGAMLDIQITGKPYEKVSPGATLRGKAVTSLAEFKGATILSWPISNKYTQLIDGLTGAEGHFLTVVYGGPVKSRFDNPAADWQVELSEEAVGV